MCLPTRLPARCNEGYYLCVCLKSMGYVSLGVYFHFLHLNRVSVLTSPCQNKVAAIVEWVCLLLKQKVVLTLEVRLSLSTATLRRSNKSLNLDLFIYFHKMWFNSLPPSTLWIVLQYYPGFSVCHTFCTQLPLFL